MSRTYDLSAVPGPWNYNPSSMKQRVTVSLLAFVAVIIAGYMGLYQWGLVDRVIDPVFQRQTEAVLNSDVSHVLRKWLRLPDAVMGLVAYAGDILFALAGSTRRWQDRPWLVILFGIDVIPIGGVSAILIILQGTVVRSWCFPCLITASVSVMMIVFAYPEFYSCLRFLHRVRKETGSNKILWETFIGKASLPAYEVAERLIAERKGSR